MELKRLNSILNSNEKCDVFFDNRIVWIQEVHDNLANIGFVDNFEEKEVNICDLYEE